MTRIRETLGVLLFFAAATVALTWPQAAHLQTHVPSFDDPLLSVWRIAWIAHAMANRLPVTDANIFYPEARTLAYTDAVLLQGLIATPFIGAGASPVLVYNLLILGSIALSGAAMYLLARRFTGSQAAGLIAGTIFAFCTFRFDHYMHLELQATVFMPLALWFLDRAFERRSWIDMLGFGLCFYLQLLSGIYYTVFLATALAAAIPIRLLRFVPADRWQFVKRLVIVTAVTGVCALPYLSIYMQNRTTVGERQESDLRLYSATPLNYAASDPQNFLHGRWGGELGRPERRLFPGIAAIVLAALGLRAWSTRKTLVLVLAVIGFVISLGVNTPIYWWLRDAVFTYRGLRAPARAGILVLLAVALFAAYGWSYVLARRPRWRIGATAAVLGVIIVESINVHAAWLVLPSQPPAIARWLSQQTRSVVLEYPLPKPDALYAIYDGLFMYYGTFHWQPTLNGYSGFYPRSYLELLEIAQDLAAPEAIPYLKHRRVDLIVLHGHYMKPDQLGEWAAALQARPDLELVAQFPEAGGADLVFRLRR